MQKEENQKKHELDHYLLSGDYGVAPEDILPVDQTFRKYFPIVSPKYLSSIPNIFWDLDIKFPEIHKVFAESTEYSQQTIELDPTLKLTYGMYTCIEDKTLGRINVPCNNNDPDTFHFKLENSDQSNVFQTIDVIRTKNKARILIVLLNGNWIELTSRICGLDFSKYGITDEMQELAIDNYYCANGIDEMDDFFIDFSRSYIGTKDFLSMEDLATILKANSNYAKIHNQLTLAKQPIL